LGFAGLGDDAFRDLVAARVMEPTSLLDVARTIQHRRPASPHRRHQDPTNRKAQGHLTHLRSSAVKSSSSAASPPPDRRPRRRS